VSYTPGFDGAEPWRTIITTIKKVQTFINNCLRRIVPLRWPDTISYTDLWERTHQLTAGDEIRRRRWGWIGHALQKPASTLTRQALTRNPQCRRKRGLSKDTGRRNLQTDTKMTGYNWGQIEIKASTGQKTVDICGQRPQISKEMPKPNLFLSEVNKTSQVTDITVWLTYNSYMNNIN